jgi:prophage regulatory protein
MSTVNSVFPIIYPLLRRIAVEQAMGKSRTTLYLDMKRGLLTKQVSLGGDRVAWPANEISAINQARIAGKSDEEIRKLVVQLEAARGEGRDRLQGQKLARIRKANGTLDKNQVAL